MIGITLADGRRQIYAFDSLARSGGLSPKQCIMKRRLGKVPIVAIWFHPTRWLEGYGADMEKMTWLKGMTAQLRNSGRSATDGGQIIVTTVTENGRRGASFGVRHPRPVPASWFAVYALPPGHPGLDDRTRRHRPTLEPPAPIRAAYQS